MSLTHSRYRKRPVSRRGRNRQTNTVTPMKAFRSAVDQHVNVLRNDSQMAAVPEALLSLQAHHLVLARLDKDIELLVTIRIRQSFLEGVPIMKIARMLKWPEEQVHYDVVVFVENLITELTSTVKPAWLDESMRNRESLQRTFRFLRERYDRAIDGLDPVPSNGDLPIQLDEMIEWFSPEETEGDQA